MIITKPIPQIKLGGTSFSAAYCLSFDSQADFIKAAYAGHYTTLDKKERIKLLKEVYNLAKPFAVKPKKG